MWKRRLRVREYGKCEGMRGRVFWSFLILSKGGCRRMVIVENFAAFLRGVMSSELRVWLDLMK